MNVVAVADSEEGGVLGFGGGELGGLIPGRFFLLVSLKIPTDLPFGGPEHPPPPSRGFLFDCQVENS